MQTVGPQIQRRVDEHSAVIVGQVRVGILNKGVVAHRPGRLTVGPGQRRGQVAGDGDIGRHTHGADLRDPQG